jgi:hypothetical protein
MEEKMKGLWLAVAAIVCLAGSAISVSAQDLPRGSSEWLMFVNSAVRAELNDAEGYLNYNLQELLFARPTWEARARVEVMKNATAGQNLPANFFAELYAQADELKAKVESEAPNRKWKAPPYTDPAVESFIKQQYAARLKGTQIVKLGMTYTTWKIWKNSIGIPTSQTKKGLVLVKVPNMPFCQIQEFVVKKDYSGGGTFGPMKTEGGVGGVGAFASCN